MNPGTKTPSHTDIAITSKSLFGAHTRKCNDHTMIHTSYLLSCIFSVLVSRCVSRYYQFAFILRRHDRPSNSHTSGRGAEGPCFMSTSCHFFTICISWQAINLITIYHSRGAGKLLKWRVLQMVKRWANVFGNKKCLGLRARFLCIMSAVTHWGKRVIALYCCGWLWVRWSDGGKGSGSDPIPGYHTHTNARWIQMPGYAEAE